MKQFIKLKNGGLQKILGRIQSVISIYGKGIRNNVIHLIVPNYVKVVYQDF